MTTKEFEKQTLEQLLIDLKDIDNYKSFRKGAFVYDLGHYQGQLLLQEIERLNNIIDELENILNLMIYQGYYDIPKPDYEGTAVQGFIATGENSEFGIRAKFILNKLKELKENK